MIIASTLLHIIIIVLMLKLKILQVFEGERTLTKDCRELGRFDLSGIPSAPRYIYIEKQAKGLRQCFIFFLNLQISY